MKKIINGKKYDTETATFVLNFYEKKGSFTDFDSDLYVKKTGEFFLFGNGGPYSVFSSSFGENGRQSGSGIVPITLEDAQKICEEYLEIDEYEKLFGAVSE